MPQRGETAGAPGRRRWATVLRPALPAIACLLAVAPSATALTRPTPKPLRFHDFGPYSGDATFSPNSSHIAYYKTDAGGTFQLMVARANGSDAHSISSRQVRGGPAPSQDKDGGVWGPKGFIALTVLDRNAIYWRWRHTPLGYFWLNNGVDSSLWVTTPNGRRWYELRRAGANHNVGILPQLVWSNDGKMLVWAECMQASSSRHPNGVWRMYAAHFNINAQGVPSLSHIRNITPAQPGLYEPGSLTPDNRHLIYTSDWANPVAAQIYEKNLVTGAVTNLTRNTVWNEHPTITPDGRAFIYLHQAELWYAPLGGREPSDGVPLTHFNAVTDPFWESAATQWPVIPTSNAISPDGTKVAVTVESVRQYPTAWSVLMSLNAPLR